MRDPLIIFSPMPPSRNGIADYCATLLPELCRNNKCIIVIDDAAPAIEEGDLEIEVLRISDYLTLRSHLIEFVHLFHIGNNKDHIYMLDLMEVPRGIMVLHDLSLYHMHEYAVYTELRERRLFHDEHVRSRRRSGALLARFSTRQGFKTILNYAELYLIYSSVMAAKAIVVHSVLGAVRVKGEHPEADVRLIPHFAEIANGGRSSRRGIARIRLGLRPETFICLSMGFVTKSKQISVILDAVADVAKMHPMILFLIVGDDNEVAVENEIRQRELGVYAKHIGYIPESEIPFYLDAADVLINLRNPTFGETSGTLCRALGRGVCSLVSFHGWYAEIPDDVVVRIRPGKVNPVDISLILLMVARQPGLQERFEARAVAWASDKLSLGIIGRSYQGTIEELRRLPVEKLAMPDVTFFIDDQDRSYLSKKLNEAQQSAQGEFIPRLWLTSGLIISEGVDRRVEVEASSLLRDIIATRFAVSTEEDDPVSCGLFVNSWPLTDGAYQRIKSHLDKLGPAAWAVFCFYKKDGFFSEVAVIGQYLEARGLLIVHEEKMRSYTATAASYLECAFLTKKASVPATFVS